VARLRELEQALAQLKSQVEEVSIKNMNVKLQHNRDHHLGESEASSEQTLQEGAVSRQLRDSLRETESKKQQLKDSERDLNRDIYQMASNYQRKVNEFDILLSEYARDQSLVDSLLRAYQVDLNSESALTQLEIDKAELYKEQIVLAKDRVKHLQVQLESKQQQGEELYNQLRDTISLQEEKLKAALDDSTHLKSGVLQTLSFM
jgi:hypothetical protein